MTGVPQATVDSLLAAARKLRRGSWSDSLHELGASWLGKEVSGLQRPTLLAIDGLSGAGKSTLAQPLAAALQAPVVHMDDLYDGWEAGPASGASRLEREVYEPLRAGRQASYQAYDWVEGCLGDTVVIPPANFVLVEGCGSAGHLWAAGLMHNFDGLLVWVQAPDALRLSRSVARDGDHHRQHLEQWMRQERLYYAQVCTFAAADIVVDAWGRIVQGPERSHEQRWPGVDPPGRLPMDQWFASRRGAGIWSSEDISG